jgi:dTDP-4-amino-4,6-dideoxygalactose transaminase
MVGDMSGRVVAITGGDQSAGDEPQRRVPFARAPIGEDDIAGVVEALRSGWITTGPKVREFETNFAARLGVRHAIALNSGTAALHLAMDAIGLKPGDEVIVPTITFAASAEVVRYFDAVPVLVDVLPETLCIDPAAARRSVTAKTRAILPIHMGGHPAEMDAIMSLATESGLFVVEDAAHAPADTEIETSARSVSWEPSASTPRRRSPQERAGCWSRTTTSLPTARGRWRCTA